ncbi:MAG: hypothetical protein QNJ54_34235 [Prochloraceae cyanobacterium]|nr:hypothetical protein [Prochloraceae cyanobacterium]
MEYIYFLANASLTLRIIDYLEGVTDFQYPCITVMHRITGWLIRIKFDLPITSEQDKNFVAFLSELGIKYEPECDLKVVFESLDYGQSRLEAMFRHKVLIVSHGHSERASVEDYCQKYQERLGYCP